jgi:hypothetical protein
LKRNRGDARLPSMEESDKTELYRSLPGARFIVDDDTVWLHIEAPSGGHALLDLGALGPEGSFNVMALVEWAEHILKLSAYPG